MHPGYQIIVCAGIVPDPLQTLEPISFGGGAPALKNEAMLPAILDPWAAHALYEAAHLASQHAGSKVWLVSLGPKNKLQQVMMTVAQKVAFEFVAIDGAAGGFSEAQDTADALAQAIRSIEGIEPARLLLFGGWESASRGAGATLQMIGEQLGITDQFQGVDGLTVRDDGSLEILERVEGGRHQVSICAGPPVVLGWATGNLPEPRNNPQIGMANLRGVMPALQKAKAFRPADGGGTRFLRSGAPRQLRETRVIKNLPPAEIAREIAAWIGKD
jgi:electron transfer flavoprotein beta subunit